MKYTLMTNTQAKGHVSNSAANSLPTPLSSQKFRCRTAQPNRTQATDSTMFSMLRGDFLAAERRFLPDGGEIPTRSVMSPTALRVVAVPAFAGMTKERMVRMLRRKFPEGNGATKLCARSEQHTADRRDDRGS